MSDDLSAAGGPADDETVEADLGAESRISSEDVSIETSEAAEGLEGDGAPPDTYPDITDDDTVAGDLVEMVEVGVRLQKERDEYLDLARRVQADFENYKRRVDLQKTEQRERAAESLALELLPVLDAGEAALSQGLEDAAALHGQLLSTLEKNGLTRVADIEVVFDPNVHEAVLHDEGDSDAEGPVVTEVLRTGYLWHTRVLRPAMVKVRG